jgi:MFS family permease
LLAAGIPVILGLYAIGVILPAIAREYASLPHAELLSQLVAGIVGIAFALASPMMGAVVARFGYRAVYFWSNLIVALAGLSVVVIGDIYLILGTRIIMGAAVAGVLVSAVTGIGTLPEPERASMFGVQTAVGGALGLLAYFLVAVLAEEGWRTPFYLHGICLLMLPFILMLPRHQVKEPSGFASSHDGTSSHRVAAGHTALLSGLPAPLLLVACYTGMTGLLPALVGPFYLNAIGITKATEIAYPLMVGAGTATIAAFFYGKLYGRIGVVAVFAAILLSQGIGALLSGLSGSLPLFSAAQVVLSLGSAWSIANLSASAILIAPPAQISRALAIVIGVFYGSQALVPFIATALSSIAGPAGVFLGFAVVGITGGLIYLAQALRHRQSLDQTAL